ncbi:CRISPR-associated protein, Csn1 family [Pediococcus damnosus]|uniref:type II CRISPR RNA-guided endonuclease Cas9 n=1 Tax=Pediococcus damnosus TaxID=51663 RepID=UPI00078B4C78|nr:type II CRISPR RNA-guided endonuclease Cas9 [Pediococcus damnosus]AMV60342.1 CRISPR-associated protein, Csn1 family [Pediococcus damnosus]AMV64592.1 CRISPR-associated protein, Csn1 family [Pediococcus damnosus]
MTNEKYSIGLDIGTSSIGFAVVNDNNRVIRVKGKNAIGVRLFDEGKAAADRRSFRTTRRRLSRRRWRLKLLREIFDAYITPVDEAFFIRLKESNLSPKDSKKQYSGDILFNDRSDKDFYEKYPTIYHLRNALMTEHRKFDVREIYLAIHHIMKFRGHFLNATPANNFKVGRLNLEEKFEELNDIYQRVFPDESIEFRTDNLEQIKEVLLDNKRSRADRQHTLVSDIYQSSEDKDIEKRNKAVATEILKASLGNKAKLNVITNVEVDKEAAKEWSITFDSESIDDDLAKIEGQMTDDGHEIIEVLRSLYSGITLSAIVPENHTLSQSMVAKYDLHKDHLKLFKKLINGMTDTKKAKNLRAAYDGYIDGVKGKVLPQEDFYKQVQVNLDDSAEANEIQTYIDQDIFMPKQRTKANGSIPHQLQQQELDQIIENQKAYYPWLAELNPNPDKKRQQLAKYKLDELVTFRVPYYVGPMITAKDQKNQSGAEFAWMIRKEPGNITPWNFDQKVDRMATANQFIKRMTTTDTYLLGEDVLPAQSLLYQKFEVLNELNKIRIDHKPISIEQKQQIFNDLFKQFKNVTIKHLQDYLVSQGQYSKRPLIEGLADEKRFNSSLSTYSDLCGIFGAKLVEENDRQEDLEKIIEWSTIFEDKKIYRAKLNDLTWLTDDQKEKLATKRYQGWGRLSRKLLVGLKNSEHRNIMDILWITNENFMQIQAEPDFAKLVTDANKGMLEKTDSQDVINDLYTSPQNKKAIRQILLVVHDIQNAMHGQAPAKIHVEFARGEERNPRRSVQRQRQVEAAYEKVSNELVSAKVRQEFKEAINNKRDFKDRLFLYFMQGGIDIYTGKQLNIDQLSSYQIDHILPQAFVKDDSLTNRVLTNENQVKADSVPIDIFGKKMLSVWGRMKDQGLISKGKYRNLTMNPENISAHTENGFINRQLVETRQVIKLAVNILADEYGDSTQIISVKADLSHQMREDFELLKNRDVNDYHHAFDAYLAAFIGNYLLKRYPKLESYFVYGDFKKFTQKETKMRRFNFIYDLKHCDQVVNKETGEILWTKDEDIKYIRHLFAYKKILVSHEVREKRGALYNQTIYKAKDDKGSGQGSKKLIRIKDDKETKIYGGYSGKSLAYMTIVQITKKNKVSYRVIGIPTLALARLNKLENDSTENNGELYKIIKPQFTHYKVDKKNGEIIETTDDFKIVVSKVRFQQLIDDAGQFFMLASDTYKNNAQQLVISNNALKAINNTNITDCPRDDLERLDNLRLDSAFDEIVKKMDKYFSAYDANNFREKIRNSNLIFYQLPVEDQWENNKITELGKRTVLTRILQGLHANATTTDMSIFKIKTPFGQLRQRSGISLSENAQLIYQSPTGLFERRVQLNKIK